MDDVNVSWPLLGFIIGTRAALAFGVALLVADRIPQSQRRAVAMTLIGIGAATTLPAARALFGHRNGEHVPVPVM